MSTNIALPFSNSTNGKPIIINTQTSPGILIHRSSSSLDFVWLWFALDDYISYLDEVYVTLIKGDSVSGYITDGAAYKISATQKQSIEIGIPISNLCELRAYINSDHTTINTVNVTASGYVHRRID